MMHKNLRKKLSVVVVALVIFFIAVGGIATWKYPLIKAVLGAKEKYTETDRPGLYVRPSRQRDITNSSCSWLRNGQYKAIVIGPVKLTLPSFRTEKWTRNDTWFHAEYKSGQVIAFMAPIAEQQQTFVNLMKSMAVSRPIEVFWRIVTVSPDDLSIFDSNQEITNELLALELKKAYVPEGAKSGYTLRIGGEIIGIQFGIGDRDRNVDVFAYLVDKKEVHGQLILRGVTQGDIDCIVGHAQLEHR